MIIMTRRKPCEVSAPMVEPTWADTNSPHDAPAIASPMRSRTWANFLLRDRMRIPCGSPARELIPSGLGEKQPSGANGSCLPCAERHRPKQRLLVRGLRAPILWRRAHLAVQFGGGVPTPARVIEHPS